MFMCVDTSILNKVKTMQELDLHEIEKFASLKGVRKVAVENFLMSMGTDPDIGKV